MTVQGRYDALNGIVSNPYQNMQASYVPQSTDGQNIMAQNTIQTGSAPLASAYNPQAVDTNCATNPQINQQNGAQAPQFAQNPPAPQGCGNNIDCSA